jgi:serine/threonine kinase PknH
MLDAMAGTTIDRRYEVVREIARGGMCVVRAATHVHTGRQVAIKTLLDGIDDTSVDKRLLQEARALETCRSPHVVEVLDAGVDGRTFVALEMLEGRGLDALLTTRQRLPLGAACGVVLDVLSALSVVHEHGLVHRDVKPANVFVARHEGGEVTKLIDFGIAHVPAQRDARGLTRAGERLGTLEYMAPEQLLGEPVGPQADLYAAMIVLFEAATGGLPYPGGPHEMLKRVAAKTPPPALSSQVAEAPAALDEVLRRGLSFEPADRFGSASELAAALQRAMGALRATGSILEPPPPPTAARGRENARAPYVTPVRVAYEGAALHGHAADISVGGLLVTLRNEVPRDRTLQARFCLPTTGKPITVDVTVRWQKEARAHRAIGLQFVSLDAAARQDIERFISLTGAS